MERKKKEKKIVSQSNVHVIAFLWIPRVNICTVNRCKHKSDKLGTKAQENKRRLNQPNAIILA